MLKSMGSISIMPRGFLWLRMRSTPCSRAGWASSSLTLLNIWRHELFILDANTIHLGTMFRSAYHAKAFLALKRNIKPGLVNRTKILSFLEGSPLSAKSLSQKTGLSYRSVLYHLTLLEAERITARGDGRPHIWELTGAGQQTLLEG